MSAPALPVTLTITVLDTATIFEGPDTVYRYDLPGTGIRDGWALAAVIDQAKELCSLSWPDVEIIVDADDPTTEVLTRSLLNKGVAAYPAEVLRETPLPGAGPDPDTAEDGAVEITRPTRRAGRHRQASTLRSYPLLIGAVVVVVVGLLWWGVDQVGGTEALQRPSAVAESGPASASVEFAPPTTGPSRADTSTPQTTASPAPRHILEHEHLRVELPAGFRLDMRETGLIAVSDDPGLRIHLAADPVYSVPGEEVEAQVRDMIGADATLEPLDPEQIARGVETIRYRESPGDGSEVTWSTWIEAEHQMSVGCHTRTRPTVPQETACRLALNSLQLTGMG